MISRIYCKIEEIWEFYISTNFISNALIVSFSFGLIAGLLSLFDVIPYEIRFFSAIDIAFSVLLIFEAMGLIFVLPRSVSSSVGKQFEILSIILLRSAFKEFGLTYQDITLESFYRSDFYHMFYDAFGALLIFLIIGFYYRLQKHEKITSSEDEQQSFINFKRLIALAILVIFLLLGTYDLYELAITGKYLPNIDTFYFILIFTDVLILLYSLRYTSKYYNIFRYSSFAFATILIRLSLSAEPPINSALGILASLFLIGVSVTYNYFRKSVNA
jgi:uncharacterized membrane protein